MRQNWHVIQSNKYNHITHQKNILISRRDKMEQQKCGDISPEKVETRGEETKENRVRGEKKLWGGFIYKKGAK